MAYTKQNKLHIVSAVAVIRNDAGRYLVLKRHEREIAYPGMYTFPGGKVEGNESIEETLAEEIREEAGLQMKPGKILLKDKSFIRPDDQTVKVFSYLCEVESTEPVTISEDFTDYKWIGIDDLQTIPHVGIDEELSQAEKLYASGISLDLLKTKSIHEERSL
jgi:8-oxo-dGTP diphosphatase